VASAVLVLLQVLLVTGQAAHAQQSGGMFAGIQKAICSLIGGLQGPLAIALALAAVVIGALMWAAGNRHGLAVAVIGIVGVAVAINAKDIITTVFGSNACAGQ